MSEKISLDSSGNNYNYLNCNIITNYSCTNCRDDVYLQL